MPGKNLKIISFTLNLFDSNNGKVKNSKVAIQFYDVTQKLWIDLISKNISDGNLKVEVKTSSRTKSLVPFLALLKSDIIPDFRIVNTKAIFELKKTEVMAIEYKSNIDDKRNILYIDFGTLWLVNKDSINKQKQTKAFILITSGSKPKRKIESAKVITGKSKEVEIKKNDIDIITKKLEDQTSLVNKLSKDLETKSSEIKSVQNALAQKDKALDVVSADNEILRKEVKNIKKENKVKDSKIEELNKNAAQLTVQISEMSKKFKKTQNSLLKKEKDLAKLLESKKIVDTKLKTATSSSAVLKKERDENIKKIEALSAQSDQKDLIVQDKLEEINSLNDQLSKIQKTGVEHQKLISDGKTKIEVLEKDLESQKRTVKKLTEQIVLINKENADKELKINEFEKRNAALGKEIESLENKVKELSDTIDFDESPIPVNSLFSNIVNEVDHAKMSNLNSNYKLANVSLKLKTYMSPHEGGVRVQVLNKKNSANINGNTISELQLDIQENNTKESSLIYTPNLLGYTETAVRKMLSNLGLRLNEVYQSNKNETNGDAFKQSPAPGTQIDINNLVTVIFSKNE